MNTNTSTTMHSAAMLSDTTFGQSLMSTIVGIKRSSGQWIVSVALVMVMMLSAGVSWGQLTLPPGGSYTQNFDGLPTMPNGWTVRTGASASVLGSVATIVDDTWANATGNFRNVVASEAPLTSGSNAAAQNSSADRALAVRQSGSFGDPGVSFNLQLANTTGKTGFSLSLTHMLMNEQTRITTYTIQYTSVSAGTSGWMNLGTFTTSGAWGSTSSGSLSLGSGLDNIANNVWIRVVALTASNGSNNRDTYGIDDFVLTWNEPPPCTAPEGLSYTVSSAQYCHGAAITDNTPSFSNTPSTPITYSVSPALPAGLSLDVNTGIISGTPTVPGAATNYTVTATNSCDDATAIVNIEVLYPVNYGTMNNANETICQGSTPGHICYTDGSPNSQIQGGTGDVTITWYKYTGIGAVCPTGTDPVPMGWDEVVLTFDGGGSCPGFALPQQNVAGTYTYAALVDFTGTPDCGGAQWSSGCRVITVTPSQTWYQDSDADGFGSMVVTQEACTQPVGYVADNSDCNDNALLYTDSDGDGVGAGSPKACGVASNTDCDDNNGGIQSPITYYADLDGDGFGDINSSTTACSLTPPGGYSANSTDCDDNAFLYADLDGDGFGAGAQVACGVANNTDCDDTQLLYVDGDNDGYGAGAPVACGVANNTDCAPNDMAVHPGAMDICGNMLDDNCNSLIDEGISYLSNSGYWQETSTWEPNGYPGACDEITIISGYAVVEQMEVIGDLTLDAASTLKGTGTLTINGTFTNNGTIAPGASPGCLTIIGNVTNSILDIELGGTTACTQYDQLNVTGNFTAAGTLHVSQYSGFNPADNDAFTIVNTTGTVSGTFATLTFDAPYNVADWTVNYGANSITLEYNAPALPVHNLTQNTYFSTIQAAINDAATVNGDEIEVAAGTYNEEVNVTKSLTILGPNNAISPNTGTRVAEAVLVNLPTGRAFTIKSGSTDVTISGFKFDGGSPIHDGNETSFPQTSDVTFSKNLVVNANAIFAGTNTSWADLIITDNKFQDINAVANVSAISVKYTSTATITDNTFIDVVYGAILLETIPTVTISGNNIDGTGYQAIQLANVIGNASVVNNKINNANNFAQAADRGAIRLYGSGFTGAVVVSNNEITGGYNGIAVKDGENITGKNITVLNNSITALAGGKAIYHGGTGTLSASCNWFGTTVPATIAAAITGPVNYSPWLASGTDSDLMTTGFQTTEMCPACTIMATANATPASCPVNSGQVLANVTMNAGAVTYLWSNGQTTNPATGLVAGAYTVTVTDVNGCTATASATVTGLNVGPVHNGANNYCTIQAAINAATNGNTITLDAGNYYENITLNKSLTIQGPNAGINPNSGMRVAEAILYPATSDPDYNSPGAVNIMYITTAGSGSTLTGLSFNGDNPNIGSGNDAVEAISAYDGVSNLAISYNIIQNITYAGIDLYNYTNGGAATSGNSITYNKIQNINDQINTSAPYEIGVILYNNCYASILDNVFNNVRSGIQTGNFSQMDPGNSRNLSNNTITSKRRGIFHNLIYGSASTFNIIGNTINTYAGATTHLGISLSSIGGSVAVSVLNNNISGAYAGVDFWNCTSSAVTTVSGGNITGCNYGVVASNFDGYNSDASSSAVRINGVSITGSTIAAVHVKDSPSNTNNATIQLTVTGNCGIVGSGAATGILVTGSDATAVVNNNLASIHGFAIGIDVDGGNATVTNNSIYDNGIGVRITNSGTANVNTNNFDGLVDDNGTDIQATATAGSVIATPNNNLAGDTYGIENQGASVINASYNYWGAANGPSGSGSAVTANVTYCPWLGDVPTAFGGSGAAGLSAVQNLNNGNYYCTLQAAIDAATAGHVLQIADMTITGEVSVVNKALTIQGVSGGNSTLTGTGVGYGLTIAASNVIIKDLKIQNYLEGIRFATNQSNITLQDLVITGNTTYGVNFTSGNLSNVVLSGSELSTSSVGFKVGGAATIDGLNISNSTIKNNVEGISVTASSGGTDVLDNVSVTSTTFDNNSRKGLYIEKLSNATFDAITVNNCGIDPAYASNSGIDLNLKYDDFVNITITNSTITSSGATGSSAYPGGRPAISVSVRDDGSYASNPATLDRFTFSNNTVSVPNHMLAFESVAGPSNAVLENNDLSALVSGKYSVINTGQSDIVLTCNWHGSSVYATIQAQLIATGTGDNILSTYSTDDTYASCLGRVHNVTIDTYYGTIQEAIDAVTTLDGHVISAAAGIYEENVLVNKQLEIYGAGQGVTTIMPAIVGATPPGCPGSDCVGASNVIKLAANNIHLHDFSIDGNNPGLTSGVVVGGQDIDARNGIIADGTSGRSNIEINNVTISNIYLRGIYPQYTANMNVHDNTVSNVRGSTSSIAIFSWASSGTVSGNSVSEANDAIAANHSMGITFSGNNVSKSDSGIHSDNNGDSGGSADIITNNTVSNGSGAGSYGIFVFVPYLNTVVSNNTITNVHVGFTSTGALFANPTLDVFGNTIDGQNLTNSLGAYIITSTFGYGDGVNNTNFHNNFITGTDQLMQLEANTGFANNLVANNNSFTGNATGIVKGGTGTTNEDLMCNWWGSSSSAGVITAAGAGTNYSPWLTNGMDDLPGTPGFQPVTGACAGSPIVISSVVASPATCAGLGQIVVTWGDGVSPYDIAWSGPSSGTTIGATSPYPITPLAPGLYSITVTDASASTATTSATVLYLPVTNTTNNPDTYYATIQAAIDAAITSDVIEVCSGTYDEQVLVNKTVTIIGVGATQPIVDFTGTPSGKPTLFDVSANGVTIDNIHFQVNLATLRSAIIATSPMLDLITVQNNLIDPYGTPAGSYGERNAVSVNYAAYRVATGGVDQINFLNNTVTGANPTFFRAAISSDEASGAFTGNNLTSINQDIQVRFASTGNISITGNTFNLGGVEIGDPNAGAGSIDISNNTFNVANGATYNNALRLKNNYAARTTTVSGNTFLGHEWGISMENYQNVSINGNSFTPIAASTTYRHITVNTKEFSSASGFYPPAVGATITNNTFFGSGAPGGIGLAFYNGDNDAPVYNSFTLGSAGNENNFDGTIGTYIYLDGQTGPTAAPVTTMAPWAVNLDAQNNTFAGLNPGAMSLTQLFAVEDKIVHKIDNSVLGFVLVKPGHDFVTVNSFSSPATTQASVQRGVDAAASGFTVNVAAGTYNEINVKINKPLTLLGAQANVACGSRGAESIVQDLTNSGLPVFTINSDDVTINGFEIIDPWANSGVDAGSTNPNNLTIKFNNIHDIGSSRGSGNVYAVRYLVGNAVTISNISITDNCINNVFNSTPSALGNSAGIWFGQSTSTGIINNLIIDRNIITNIYAGLAGKAASGIDVGTAWNNITGKVNNLKIRYNTISGISGGQGYGIQLDGKTPGAEISNNTISNVVSPFNAAFAVGVLVPNTNTGSALPTPILINNNSITTVTYTIANGSINLVNATCNWYGTAIPSAVAALISGPVSYSPFLTNGTDDQPGSIGFQPVPGSCNGFATDLYVNDNSQTGDVYTTAIGNDANPGTPAAPFATMAHAVSVASAGNTIYVDAGTYNESVVVNKSISILGSNAIISPNTGSRVAESILVNTSAGRTFSIYSGNTDVIISGFKFDGGSPIHDGNDTNNPMTSDVTFSKNWVVNGNAIYAGTNTSWEDLLITDNKFQDINATSTASAMQVSYTSTTTITDNTFTNVNYAAMVIDATPVVNISGNTIDGTGAQAIQLAGAIGNATVINNKINDANRTLQAADRGAIRLYGSGFTGAVSITNNEITGGYNGITVKTGENITGKNITVNENSITGLNSGKAIYHGGTGVLSATCNWYGTAVPAAVAAQISGPVSYSPFLTNGNDDQPSTFGFQPVPGSCNGFATDLYVNDNVQTGDVYTTAIGNDANPGTPAAPFATMAHAISVANAGNTIYVDAGTYNENININKANIALKGANFGASCGSRGPAGESIINGLSGPGSSVVIIGANGLTVDGFTISGASATYGVSAAGMSGVTVRHNIITDLGATGAQSTSTFGIGVAITSADISGINLSDNCISDIRGGSGAGNTGGAVGIGVGFTNADNNVSGLTVVGNTINNITASTAGYGSGGRGAYGVLINVGASGSHAGQAISPVVSNNEISVLTGLWAHGVGLEGETPGAMVLNNKIDGLTGTGGSNGVKIEDNDGAATVEIHENSFTNLGFGIQNVMAAVVNATCNWYGTAVPAAVAAQISGPVSYSPFLTNGTDNSASIGFQPVSGSCNGFATDLYVNDNSQTGDVYTTAIGNDANPGTAAAPFATIQHAINAASNGNTIFVDAGSYAEDIIVNKELTINGSNAMNDACGITRVEEAIIVPATAAIATGEIFHVAASNVTISGFTIDGDNPNLTSGFINTTIADIDAAEGVTVYETGINNVHVTNNIIKNLSYFGVTMYDYPAGVASSGHIISNNKFQDLGTYGAAPAVNNWGGGVLLYNNQYAAVTDNCMTNVRIGVQTGNFYRANPGLPASQMISGNTIQARSLGIFHNLFYSLASPYTLDNNTISGLFNANETKWTGILLTSLSQVVHTASNNNIDATAIAIPKTGISAWNDQVAPLISGGTITGVGIGINVNNYEGYASNANNTAATITGTTITNASIAGIKVHDNPSNTNGATVTATIGNNNTISGSPVGVLVSGSDATATVMGNNFTGNQVDIQVAANTGVVTASPNNNLSGSSFGIENLSTNVVNGTNNYWNDLDDSGPGSVGSGTGVKVSSMVNFCPWLNDFAPTGTPLSAPVGAITVAETGGPVDNDGSICASENVTLEVVGAKAGSAYLWSTGATTASIMVNPAVTTIYSVTVSYGGCSTVLTNTITVYPVPVVDLVSLQNVLCNGGSTGSIQVVGTVGPGAYSYAWSNGPTAALNPGLPIGMYTVTVTDANLCKASDTYTITQPPLLSVINYAVTNETCQPCNDGTITVNATGGTTAYMYSKDGGTTFQVSNLFSNLIAGVYNMVVKDANGCLTVSEQVIITEVGVYPDLTPANIISSAQFINPSSKNQVIFIRNIGTGATSAPIVFRITKFSSGGMTNTQNLAPSVTILGDIYTLNNNDFDMVSDGLFWKFTSKPTVVIAPGGVLKIGMILSRSGGGKGTQNSSVNIESGTGGGDTSNSNNSLTFIITKL